MGGEPPYLGGGSRVALGDLLVNAGGLVLVPLYTRCLSRGEFDSLEILDTTAQVLMICVLARGIPQAVFAFAKQSRTDAMTAAEIFPFWVHQLR